MMARNLLIGLGAGIATALLSLGPATGAMLSIPLYFLSPLPIAIAGLGFGTWSGVAAAATATVVLSAVLRDVTAGLIYVVVFGAPVAWAAHLVGLSRQTGDTPESREWFPLDLVLIRATLASAVAVTIWLTVGGFDKATTAEGLLDFLVAITSDDNNPAVRLQMEPIARALAGLMPFIFAGWVLFVAVLNTWLGARIARMSDLLQRPWMPIWSVYLPRVTAALLAVTIALAFLPGQVGEVAAAFAGALAFAFALTGYGYLHFVLRGRAGKGALLSLLYVFSILFNPMLAAMCLVGIADSVFGFRARRIASEPAPPKSDPMK